MWQSDDHRTTGPFNPIETKSALVSMSRNGKIKLLYQTYENSWPEVVTSVDDMLFNNETYLTHASFAPDTGKSQILAHAAKC